MLTSVFWKMRIIDLGTTGAIFWAALDLYIQHFPMTAYGFRQLRLGHYPLWNPYYFCGQPFAAIPYVGLLYPPNLVYLALDTALATEISLAAHMLFGGASMWLFLRRFRLYPLACLCGAISFMWSGLMIHYVNQPSLFAALTWAPLTVLLVDQVLSGERLARLWLALAVAAQLLTGAAEVALHTCYLAGILTLCRTAQLWNRRGWRPAVANTPWLGVSALAGVALTAAQIVPTAELVLRTVRAPGSLTFAQIVGMGGIRPASLLAWSLSTSGLRWAGAQGVTIVGVMPLLALAFVLRARRTRTLWAFALITLVVAVSLISGGWPFRVYYHLPGGALFRRPQKFLDMMAFSSAVLVGLATARLRELAHLPRPILLQTPPWLCSVLIGVAVCAWLTWRGTPNVYLILATGSLAAFGAARTVSVRSMLLAALCGLQAASLFFALGNIYRRPLSQPGILESHDALLRFMKQRLNHGRVYVSNSLAFGFRLQMGLQANKGVLSEIEFVTGYEPLTVARYATYFNRVSGAEDARQPFAGIYPLGTRSGLKLLELTGTKYFLVRRGDRSDKVLAHQSQGPAAQYRLVTNRRLPRYGRLRLYENKRALPRAYFVPAARLIEDPVTMLDALQDEHFAPRAEVLLEQQPEEWPMPSRRGRVRARATIIRYEPERVIVEVRTNSPGFVVLSDLYYPGWRAFVRGRAVPIYHANYLFRAVQVPAGRSRLVFRYSPDSAKYGFAISAFALLSMVGATFASCRIRSRRLHSRRCDVQSRNS